MDNFTLQALVEEIRPIITGARCVHIGQHGARTFVLEFSSEDAPFLVLDFSDPYPLAFCTTKSHAFDTAPPFVALARKWLLGATLRTLHKRLDERIVHFEFSQPAYQRRHETLELVVELVPQWGNLYLLDSTKSLLGAWLVSRMERRSLAVGASYEAPRKHGDLSIEDFLPHAPRERTAPLTELTEEEFAKGVRGLSPTMAHEVWTRSQQEKKTPARALAQWLHTLRSRTLQPHLYRLSDQPSDFFPSPLKMKSLPHCPASSYVRMSEMLQFAFEERAESTSIERERRNLRRRLQGELKKLRRLAQKIEEETARFTQDIDLQKIADLILSRSGAGVPKGELLSLVDWFDPRQPRLSVRIDPRLSLTANAQVFHERAKRARRALERIRARASTIQQKLRSTEEALALITSARTLGELNRMAASLPTLSLSMRSSGRRTPPPVEKDPSRTSETRTKRKCRVFVSSDAREILVGRNSKENDRVTMEYAHPDDYWFHTADYAGSHVVLLNPHRETLETSEGFLQAAQLAAYFSQARNANKVSVHWTQRKFVKKPKRAKPGQVTLSKFQTVFVEPKLPPQPHPRDPECS